MLLRCYNTLISIVEQKGDFLELDTRHSKRKYNACNFKLLEVSDQDHIPKDAVHTQSGTENNWCEKTRTQSISK